MCVCDLLSVFVCTASVRQPLMRLVVIMMLVMILTIVMMMVMLMMVMMMMLMMIMGSGGSGTSPWRRHCAARSVLCSETFTFWFAREHVL